MRIYPVAALLCAASLGHGQPSVFGKPGLESVVVAGKTAYLPLSAKVAVSGMAISIKWSGDGKTLLIIRPEVDIDDFILKSLTGVAPSSEAKPVFSIHLYDLPSGKAKEVWRGELIGVPEVHSLAESSLFVLSNWTTEHRNPQAEDEEYGTESVVLLSSAGIRPLLSMTSKPGRFETITLSHSPNNQTLLMVRQSISVGNGMVRTLEAGVNLLDARGRIRSIPLPLPENARNVGVAGWAPQTQNAVVSYVVMPAREDRGNANVRAVQHLVQVNVNKGDLGAFGGKLGDLVTMGGEQERMVSVAASGAPSAVAAPPDSPKAFVEARELRAEFLPMQAKAGNSVVRSGALVLMAEDGSSTTTVFGGMAFPELSPKLNAIAYAVEGAVFVRKLSPIDKATYERMKEESERTRLISDCKQAALGALLYGADNDDKLPSSSENIQELLMPYLRNADILSGFTYVFAGGDITKVESPAETILGYKIGKGGRAVAYLDGHVKWIKDP